MSIYLQNGSLVSLSDFVCLEKSIKKEYQIQTLNTIIFGVVKKDYTFIKKYIMEFNFPLIVLENGYIINPNYVIILPNKLFDDNNSNGVESIYGSSKWYILYKNERLGIGDKDYEKIKNYHQNKPYFLNIADQPDQIEKVKRLNNLTFKTLQNDD
jgi:hypothetical protein